MKYDNKISEVVDPLAEPIDAQLIYKDVRIRRKKDKSRVRIENVPPESFRISRDAKSIDDAVFVVIQVEMTRREIRKQWPEIVSSGSEKDWNELGTDAGWMGSIRNSQDVAAGRFATGKENGQGSAGTCP